MIDDRRPDRAIDHLVASWLDERAHGPAADAVVEAALARTEQIRPLPWWLSAGRWIPAGWEPWLRQAPRLVPILILIALLIAIGAAISVVGSHRRLPPPFGLAAPGEVAFVADGHVWTASADGSDLRQLTFDQRIDQFPTFSADGTKIAFKRLPDPGSKPDWQAWGDVVVADADGGHPILVDPLAHAPSPMTWSPDGRFLVYSKMVGDADQVFRAATDGSLLRQLTSGPEPNWGPILSPDGRTIAFVKGDPATFGLYVIRSDGTGERRLTRNPIDLFGAAEWAPDGSTLVYDIGQPDGHADVWAVGLDGRPERRLVGAAGNDLGETVSPEGRSIAWLGGGAGPGAIGNLSPGSRVMVAAADGSGAHPISAAGDWYFPQWSPNARQVLAVDASLGGGQPVVAVLDPLGIAPAASFAIPDAPGLARGDVPSWQRLAP